MKLSLLRNYFVAALVLMLIFSCKKKTETPVDLGYSYFPSNIGHWVLYDVDSTYWNNYNHTIYKSHFKLKEYIESTYYDNQNRPTQRIERYKKSDTLPFYLKNVWAANLTASTAERVEDNIRYVKLVFPISPDATWNGNAYNIYPEMDYSYSNLFMPYYVDTLSFDSTVTVIQDIDLSAVNANLQFEVFAKNVGMVYKRYRNLTKLPQPPPHPDSIISGVDYSMKIISFGN